MAIAENELGVASAPELTREYVLSARWMSRAACRGTDPNIFYPGSDDYHIATRFCSVCPVQQECLDYAILNREDHGMWGGETERERRRLASGIRREYAIQAESPAPVYQLVDLEPTDAELLAIESGMATPQLREHAIQLLSELVGRDLCSPLSQQVSDALGCRVSDAVEVMKELHDLELVHYNNQRGGGQRILNITEAGRDWLLVELEKGDTPSLPKRPEVRAEPAEPEAPMVLAAKPEPVPERRWTLPQRPMHGFTMFMEADCRCADCCQAFQDHLDGPMESRAREVVRALMTVAGTLRPKSKVETAEQATQRIKAEKQAKRERRFSEGRAIQQAEKAAAADQKRQAKRVEAQQKTAMRAEDKAKREAERLERARRVWAERHQAEQERQKARVRAYQEKLERERGAILAALAEGPIVHPHGRARKVLRVASGLPEAKFGIYWRQLVQSGEICFQAKGNVYYEVRLAHQKPTWLLGQGGDAKRTKQFEDFFKEAFTEALYRLIPSRPTSMEETMSKIKLGHAERKLLAFLYERPDYRCEGENGGSAITLTAPLIGTSPTALPGLLRKQDGLGRVYLEKPTPTARKVTAFGLTAEGVKLVEEYLEENGVNAEELRGDRAEMAARASDAGRSEQPGNSEKPLKVTWPKGVDPAELLERLVLRSTAVLEENRALKEWQNEVGRRVDNLSERVATLASINTDLLQELEEAKNAMFAAEARDHASREQLAALEARVALVEVEEMPPPPVIPLHRLGQPPEADAVDEAVERLAGGA